MIIIYTMCFILSFFQLHCGELEDIAASNVATVSDYQIGITNGGMLYDEPVRFFFPKNTEEVVKIIQLARTHKRSVRVVGAMHSLNPICYTQGYMVSLEQMNHMFEINEEECTVEGGIVIRDLCLALEKEGLALAVLGSICEQSITGAIATGTRGQIPSQGSLGSLVNALEIVDGNGNVKVLTKNDSDFYAAVTSLGVFGIVTKITLKCCPLSLMTEVIRRRPLNYVLEEMENLKQSEKLVLFWNVAGDEVKVITGHRIESTIAPKELATFDMLGVYPHLHTMENFSDTIQRIGKSWELITLLRWTPEKNARRSKLMREQDFGIFQGDYAVKQSDLAPLLHDVQEYFQTHQPKLSKDRMVVEIRPVSQDPVWLSPSYGQDIFSLCFHDFDRPLEWTEDGAKDFIEFENFLKERYNIRPHFGKAHFFSDSQLQKAYPKWNEFKQLRKKYDPDGVFLNDYLRNLLTNF